MYVEKCSAVLENVAGCSFSNLCVSSSMAGIHRCPVLSSRSAQKFGGKNKKKNMKR